jgi:carboxymethylenebutenolidase
MNPLDRPSELWTRPVEIPVREGVVTGHLALPEGPGPHGAVVITHELNGFRPAMIAAARRLAAAGFAALAVDLYAPLGGVPRFRAREEVDEWMKGLDDPRQLADLERCVDWLGARPEADARRISLQGYSIGGCYALLLAARRHDFAGVVVFYSRPWPPPYASHFLSPGDLAVTIRCPVLGIFGGADEITPPDMVERFRRVLAAHGVPHEFHSYPDCPHLFANESYPRFYRAAEAEDAWWHVLAFHERMLGTGASPRAPGRL